MVNTVNVKCIYHNLKKNLFSKKEDTWCGPNHGEWQVKEMNAPIFCDLGTWGIFE